MQQIKLKSLLALILLLILASCKDDKKSEILVNSVTMKPTTKDLYVGDSFQLEATVLPANATDKTLTWSSSNDNVTVDPSGKITAVKEGKATIIVAAKDGSGAKATCEVTVKAKAGDGGNGGSEDGNGDGNGNGNEGNVIKVSSVTMVPTAKDLYVGDSFQLEATVLPADAADKTLTWSSSNDNVTVDPSGKVTAEKEGNATITATAKDGSEAKATCEVTVKKSTNYKSAYTKSDYYQWDAYESCDKENTGKWESGSSFYHDGENVTAEQSCKEICDMETAERYLSEDVYWDTESPVYKVDGSEYKIGLWVMKKEFISATAKGQVSRTPKKLSELSETEQNKIRSGEKYFFLPAGGSYVKYKDKDGFYNVGRYGCNWLSASRRANAEYTNPELAYAFYFDIVVAKVTISSRYVGFLTMPRL